MKPASEWAKDLHKQATIMGAENLVKAIQADALEQAAQIAAEACLMIPFLQFDGAQEAANAIRQYSIRGFLSSTLRNKPFESGINIGFRAFTFSSSLVGLDDINSTKPRATPVQKNSEATTETMKNSPQINWVRLPKTGERLAGFARTTILEMRERGEIRTSLIRRKGAKRGILLIDLNSLNAFIESNVEL